jgi:hypothetical protein
MNNMLTERKRINKNIIVADSIDMGTGWALSQHDNIFMCGTCKSPLFYVVQRWAVVKENTDYEVMGIGKQYLVLRVVGLALYCAECGEFNEDYDTFAYRDEDIVCLWDDKEIEYTEKEEITYWLEQINHTGDFKPAYPSSAERIFRVKYEEFRKKNPTFKHEKETKPSNRNTNAVRKRRGSGNKRNRTPKV